MKHLAIFLLLASSALAQTSGLMVNKTTLELNAPTIYPSNVFDERKFQLANHLGATNRDNGWSGTNTWTGISTFSGAFTVQHESFILSHATGSPALTVVAHVGQTTDVFIVEDNSDADKITVDKDINLNLNGNKIYGVGNGGIAFSGTGALDTRTNLFPDQTGNSGKYLTTNGTVVSWGTVTAGGVDSAATLTADRYWNINGHTLTIGGLIVAPTQISTGGIAFTTDGATLGLTGGTLTDVGGITFAGTGAATTKTNLSLVVGTNIEAWDADLDAFAGLTGAADKLPYFTGTHTMAQADFPAQARTLLAATTAALQRTALGATTVGANLLTLPDPGAITFPRFNANNSVSALSASAFLTAIGGGLDVDATLTADRYWNINGHTLNVGGLLITAAQISTQGASFTTDGAVLDLTGGAITSVGNGGISFQGTGAADTRTNLSLGTAATHASTDYALVANNLSDLANVATARTNLGLGTAALISSTAGGDLSGTLPSPTVIKINGVQLSSLGTGLLKNTTTTGALSIATAGTDYYAPGGTDVTVGDGGTGISAGTSGGIPYFSSTSTIASSGALAANALVIGGGAGVAPATTTTGTGVLTALGVNTGSAGALVVNGGALGTPSSGTVTNLTGTASININGTVGATTPTTGAFTTKTATGLETFTMNSLGASQTAVGSNTDIAIQLHNTTAGANNAQQISPELEFRGQGWATGAGQSQTLLYRIGALPVQGSSTISGSLNIRSSVAAQAFANSLQIFPSGTTSSSTTTGTGVITGGLGVSGAEFVGGGITSTGAANSFSNTTITGAAATTALTLTQTARTSGVLPYIKWTIPTDTGQTAATESPGVVGVTGTRTWATTGTVALQREIFFPGPTYASASPSQTFTDAFNMYLTPPIAGTNAIFTRGHTLGVVDSTSAATPITGGLVVATTPGTGATSVGIGGGNISLGGKMLTYNNVATAGWGQPAIYAAGRVTAQNAASASVATYTVGASDGSFIVSANVLVTTSTVHAFTVTCAYTDEGNTARTITFNFTQLSGTIGTSIANSAGAVPYEGIPLHIRCKAATAITIATTGTFTTVTYNAEGIIQQVN
jgi:hypothetical protein